MAAPLSDDRLLKALRDEGVDVVEHSGWRTRTRPASTGAFGPINGVMIHHTVTSGTSGSVDLCIRGHSSLPGPLCHLVISKDGQAHLISNGRANHAGRGDSGVLAKVRDESYDRGTLLRPSKADADGNTHFYGFECVNLGNGKDPWPEAQRDCMVRAAAAICRAYDWTAKSVIGHLEWQPGKIDPKSGAGGVDVSPPTLRRLVDERLAHPASWSPGEAAAPKPTPKPAPEDGMPSAEEIADAVWAHRITNQFRKGADGKPRAIAAEDYLEYGDKHHDDVMAAIAQLSARVEHLAVTVDRIAASLAQG